MITDLASLLSFFSFRLWSYCLLTAVKLIRCKVLSVRKLTNCIERSSLTESRKLLKSWMPVLGSFTIWELCLENPDPKCNYINSFTFYFKINYL